MIPVVTITQCPVWLCTVIRTGCECYRVNVWFPATAFSGIACRPALLTSQGTCVSGLSLLLGLPVAVDHVSSTACTNSDWGSPNHWIGDTTPTVWPPHILILLSIPHLPKLLQCPHSYMACRDNGFVQLHHSTLFPKSLITAKEAIRSWNYYA